MELTFLGTAGPRGWPQPFCICASCLGCTGSAVREPSCVLVDGTLLIDCGPEPAHAAARASRPLTGVRHLLLTGPAEAAPLAWLPAAGLELVAAPSGPPAGLPAPTAGGPPWQTVEPGAEFAVGAHRVRVLPGGSPGRVAYAVTGPGGSRLLYIPSSRLAPEADTARSWADGRPYDAVLLDVVAWPERLAALRREGAVTEETDVLAVHLSHEAPPGEELTRRLAAWGARAVADGGVVRLGSDPDPQPVRPHRTLVLGGARSGKSVEAERRLAAVPDVLYVATGGTRDGDPEWAERVAAHRDRRPATWSTAETTDLASLVTTATVPLLVDCLSLWLTAVMDECNAWDDDAWQASAREAVRKRVDELAAAWRGCRVPLVAVSNEVGSGVVPATASGRRYRDELGRLNAAVAEESDEVLLVVAGQALTLRGLPRKPRHARN
ncbi:MAG TPA: bifunctional adenosylcobinamide kinase/adenosylcobinamide-phosphate guanylyltransferase [Yinghuangia sp.]|nr:bifunctional adenosylcobinamide kinase/adenosylcobinamide-phosphate guanylyltransferase [Yinghuangia sp.]